MLPHKQDSLTHLHFVAAAQTAKVPQGTQGNTVAIGGEVCGEVHRGGAVVFLCIAFAVFAVKVSAPRLQGRVPEA